MFSYSFIFSVPKETCKSRVEKSGVLRQIKQTFLEETYGSKNMILKFFIKKRKSKSRERNSNK